MVNKPYGIKMGNRKIFARLANESDCEDIFHWENDLRTRAMSVNRSLFTFENHLNWLNKSLKNINRFLYIVVIDGKKIGLVRFDKISVREYELSLILNPKYRGLGFSNDVLRSGTSLFLNSHGSIDRFIASIRNENIASIKCFTNFGFKFENADTKFNFYYYQVKPA